MKKELLGVPNSITQLSRARRRGYCKIRQGYRSITSVSLNKCFFYTKNFISQGVGYMFHVVGYMFQTLKYNFVKEQSKK